MVVSVPWRLTTTVIVLVVAGALAGVPAVGVAATSAAPSASGLAQRDPGWALDRIDQRHLPLDARYRARNDGSGVTVYVVDCGGQVRNRAFEGRARRGPNLAKGPWGDCTDSFAVGHATFVAGIVGGRSTGVAQGANLVLVRTLEGGEGIASPPMRVEARRVADALDWVIKDAAHHRGPAVVNLSLGFPKRFVLVDQALRRLERAGIAAVVAAGNDARDACNHTPANVATAVTVAASNRNDRRWNGSNTGRCVDVFAPGVGVRSVLRGGGVFTYRRSGATSWATPYVTGAAALYLAAHPRAKPPAVRRWILRSSTEGQLSGLPAGTPNRLLYSFAALR